MQSEIIYKALSRPALLFGVPTLPCILVCGVIMLLATYSGHLLFMSAVIPAVFVMKQITKKDDLAFRVLGISFMFFTNPLSKKFYYGLKGYNTNTFEKNTKLHNFGYPKLTPLNGLESVPSISKFLPYQTLINDIVITKDFNFLATWQISGIAFELENEDELDMYKNSLNSMLKTFNNQNISFYFHNCRVGICENFNDAKFPNEYLQNLNTNYYKSFTQEKLKENKMFLTAIFSPFPKAEKMTLKKDNLQTRTEYINKKIVEFRKICISLDESLRSFNPKRLTTYEKDGNKFSQQLEFYNYLISGKFSPVRTPNAPIFLYLNGNLNEILFSHHTMQFKTNTEKSIYAKAIEIKDYPNESFSGIFDILLYANVEYTITQSFVPINKKDSLNAIKLQERRLISAEDDAISQIQDLVVARDELQSGDIIFGNYHFSIIVYENSLDEVSKKANAIVSDLSDAGFLAQQSSVGLPATYFAQFPSNFGIRPRLHTVSSANFASFLALHTFPKGKKEKNPWGAATTILKTINKQPYFFNFHEEDFNSDKFGEAELANTLIIGKSGGGKTALMNFMLNQLCKFADKDSFPSNLPLEKRKATFFYLDKDKGAMGNIIAGGGKYITMDAGNPTGFNPFMCEATAENRRRLKMLMKMIVTKNGKVLKATEEEKLNRAVDSVLNAIKNPKDRKHGISLLIQSLTEGKNEDNSIVSILKAWTYGNEFGWVFDNENDTLDLSDDNILIYGIDGTDLLRDEEVSPFIAYYIFWRIYDCLDGRRFVLFIDELWSWLKNKVVANEIFDKEKTIRKLNGFLVLGTQSVNEIIEQSSIAPALIEQSATVILLSNPRAKESDYCVHLSMTKEEYAFVKQTDPKLYRFIVKKGVSDRVIATIDMSGIDKTTLKLLSTEKAYVQKIQAINDNKEYSYEDKYLALKELYK